nr:hypothetical protein Itr_chr05CG17530 [Ipomoea trifida]
MLESRPAAARVSECYQVVLRRRKLKTKTDRSPSSSLLIVLLPRCATKSSYVSHRRRRRSKEQATTAKQLGRVQHCAARLGFSKTLRGVAHT